MERKWFEKKTKLKKFLIKVFMPNRYGICYDPDEKEYNHITTYKECKYCYRHHKIRKKPPKRHVIRHHINKNE